MAESLSLPELPSLDVSTVTPTISALLAASRLCSSRLKIHSRCESCALKRQIVPLRMPFSQMLKLAAFVEHF